MKIKALRQRLADMRGRGAYAGWSDENRAIFIHVPKTAGTSLSRQLGLSTSRHIPVEEYRIANPRKFSTYFKFCCVRNPYDRLVSSYSFLKGGGMNEDDSRFAADHVQPFESFEHFVFEGLNIQPEIRDWVHFRPQTSFVCSKTGRNLMDMTGRFENLNEDYAHIAKRLNKPMELPVTNQSLRINYREAYTAATIDIVRRIYGADIETFGYKFD